MSQKNQMNIDNFLKAQKRIDEKNSKQTPLVPSRVREVDYDAIHKRFKILCNNSINGGDCHGETMCVCKCFLYDENYHKYYSKEPLQEDLHHDFRCNKCLFHICGCCFTACPKCGEFDAVELPW